MLRVSVILTFVVLKAGSANCYNYYISRTIIHTEIMENHILQLTFCSAAVIDDDSRVSAFNILGERMTLERLSTENATDNEINSESSTDILINGKSKMIEADFMATNGVLHVSV